MTLFRILSIGIFLCLSNLLTAQEVCNNAIDDDGDGLIDLNDPDCSCGGSTTTPSSIIPNPSFEDTLCCPSNFGQLNCANQWQQASNASTDYLHACDFNWDTGNAGLLPYPDGQAAVALVNFGNYKEYLGTCLLAPMLAGTSYTLQFSIAMTGLGGNGVIDDFCVLSPGLPPSIDLELTGSANCGNLPFTGSGCPTAAMPSYSVLGSAAFNTAIAGYQTLTMNFTPTFDVNEIVLGLPCNMPPTWPGLDGAFVSCRPYLVIDNLILNSTNAFGSNEIATQGSFCGNNLILDGTSSSVGTYQWYENGIAIIGQTNATLDISNSGLLVGNYSVLFDDGTNCFITEITVDNQTGDFITSNDAQICEGDTTSLTALGGTTYSWQPNSGLSANNSSTILVSPKTTTTYIVTGTGANGCSGSSESIVTVIPLPDDVTYTISPIPVETVATISLIPSAYSYSWTFPDGLNSTGNPISFEFPEGNEVYEFNVTAEDTAGCTFDYNIPVQVSSSLLVYVPNTFTPDGNEFNDVFKPIISDEINRDTYVLKVFNRWGQILFESRDLDVGWDGTFGLKKASSGVYSWTIDLDIINADEPRQYVGHVNLLR